MTLGLMMVGHSNAAALASLARQAEQAGYTQVWIADERFYRDAYALLTYVASQTERIQLGPCVTDPFSRHPALTAVAMYTLDEISGGRAILGMGAGVSGFAEMDLPRAKPIRAMREAVELVRALASGQEISFEGEVVKFREGKLGFVPSRPSLPVWIASNGPQGQSMAAAIADAVIMEGCANPIEAKAFRKHIDEAATAAGRKPGDVRCIARVNVSVSDNRADAIDALRLRAARSLASGRTTFATLANQGLTLSQAVLAKVANVPYKAGAAPYEIIRNEIGDDMVRAISLGGTPSDLRTRVEELFVAGIDGLIVSPLPAKGSDVAATAERFAREIWAPLADKSTRRRP